MDFGASCVVSGWAGACARCLATRDGTDGCISCMEWAGRLRNLRNVLRESRNFFGKSADHILVGDRVRSAEPE